MKKLNRKNPHGNQSSRNSSKSALPTKNPTRQNSGVPHHGTKSERNVTDEAIDVLSLMGFKL
jgi:hypothetical protein